IATRPMPIGRRYSRGTGGPSMAKARTAMINPRHASSVPTSVGNSAGPILCMEPQWYCSDSSMNPAATAMKNSPDQKSLGERIRIKSACHAGDKPGTASIRPDLRLFDDYGDAGRRAFHLGVELGWRGRRGLDA